MSFPAQRLRPALLAILLLSPACGGNPVLPTAVDRAVINIASDPNPVLATASTQLGATFVAHYTVVITEAAGQGGVVQSVNSILYDDLTGAEIGLVNYDTADLVVFVGEKRIEANGTLSVPQQIQYTIPIDSALKAARLQITVQFKDDHGNLVGASILVKVQ